MMSTGTTSELPDRRRWAIALVLFAVIVTGFFDRISIAVLFTNDDFNAVFGTAGQPAKLGLLMSSFLIAYALSSIVLSAVGDLLGLRRMLAASAALWGVLMAIAGSLSSYLILILVRLVLGTSEGPQFSLVAKLIKRWFPTHEQARANAIWMVGSPIGSAIGFPFTIWLVAQFGWRASFYVLGALSFCVVMPLVLWIVRDGPDRLHSVVERPQQRFRMDDMRVLMRDRRFWLITLYSCGLLTYLWGLNGWLPTYLARARGFDVRQMGIFSSLPFIMMFAGELCSGFLADLLGRRAVLSLIGLFGAGALCYLATIVANPHAAAVLLACSAGCWGLALPAKYALAMEVIPSSVMSTGIGIMNGVGNLIGAFAPVLIGWVISTTGSYDSGLLVIVVASLLSSLALLPIARL